VGQESKISEKLFEAKFFNIKLASFVLNVQGMRITKTCLSLRLKSRPMLAWPLTFRSNIVKLFTDIIYKCLSETGVARGRLLQQNLMFAIKVTGASL